ncbi:MAG: MarR family winged helix-turn-helix transcriptional regulator [Acidimicrobiales bacterium]
MHQNPTELSDSGVELRDAILASSRVFVAIATRSLADTADEVTLAQYRTLVILASRGSQNLAALAANIAVTPATATRMCDRLVHKGLIRRSHRRDDRRTVQLSLTNKGRELVDSVTKRRRHEIERLLDAVPIFDRSTLIRALQQFTKAGGEVPEQDWSTGWDI